jgi:competence protein ComEC
MLGELIIFSSIWMDSGWLSLALLALSVMLISSKQISPFAWVLFFVMGCLVQTFTLKMLDPGKVEYVGYVSKGGTGRIEASNGRLLRGGEWIYLPQAVNIDLSDRKAVAFPGQIVWSAGRLRRSDTYPLLTIESEVEGCIDRFEIISLPGKHIAGLLSKYELDNTIAAAVFTGDRKHIEYELRRTISDLGIAHLFAVSGLHVGLMYLLVHSALSFLMVGRNSRIIASISLLFLYTLSTGPAISALRTFLMLLCYSIFRIIDYRQHPLNILGLSGMIIVMVQPSIVASISFQLSFFATAALLIFLPKIEKKSLIYQAFLVGAIAQMAIVPLSLTAFGTLSLVGIPLTILMVPMFVMPSYIGMISILVSDFLGIEVVSSFISGSLRTMSNIMGKVTASIGEAIPAMRFEAFPAYFISLLVLFLFFIAFWHLGHKP